MDIPFGNIREVIEDQYESSQKQTNILQDRVNELWYFIIATLVFTFIGIISVLTYLGV